MIEADHLLIGHAPSLLVGEGAGAVAHVTTGAKAKLNEAVPPVDEVMDTHSAVMASVAVATETVEITITTVVRTLSLDLP